MAKAVAKTNNGDVGFLVDVDDAKLGGTVGAADLALPFLKILQGLSSELKRDKPNYIKGASIGDIVLTVINKHWEGSAGVEVIFCHYGRVFVEWRPLDAGGGIVNVYPPEDRIVTSTPRGEKGAMTLSNGNSLIETAYHAVLVNVDGRWVQAVLPLKSTMLKISRRLNNQLTTFELPGRPGLVAPRWVQRWLMTTGTAAGGGNDWAVPVFEPMQKANGETALVDQETYKLAKQWAIAAGKSTNFASAEEAQESQAKAPETSEDF